MSPLAFPGPGVDDVIWRRQLREPLKSRGIGNNAKAFSRALLGEKAGEKRMNDQKIAFELKKIRLPLEKTLPVRKLTNPEEKIARYATILASINCRFPDGNVNSQ